MKIKFIHHLEERLRHPLPGADAQYKMAHAVRRSEESPPAHARNAGVLALFYPKAGQWYLVLIERQSHNPDDRHRGQISFPGGRYEPGDGHLRNTALRETEEEVGVEAGTVNVLGSLTELYIPVSNYLVHPYVGYVDYHPSFRPEEKEVKSIIEIPLDHLQQPCNIRLTDMKISEHIVLKEVPYFDVEGKIVWGATAMMLSELLEVIGGGEEGLRLFGVV